MDAGPIGGRVGGTVRQLRRALGLNLRQLAEAMTALGRPTAERTLLNVELGLRRVDVDDLVALALALDVSPARLLMPLDEPTEDDQAPLAPSKPGRDWVDLTPTVGANWADAWAWVTGERPVDSDGNAAWHRLNRPHAARPIDRDALNQQARAIRQLVHQLQVSAAELERAAAREHEQHPVEVLEQIHARRTKENPHGR